MNTKIDQPAAYAVTEVDHRDAVMAQQLHRVQVAGYQVESQLIRYPKLPPLLEKFEDIQTSPERFLACWHNEQVAGLLSFARREEEVEICRLVVDPEFFRRGVGSRLLITLEQNEVDCRTLWVSTAELNLPAINLYEKHGYRVRMQRTLPDGLRLVGLVKIRGSF